MNNRTRQWFRASAMLDRHDPQIMAIVKDFDTLHGVWRYVVIFRKSKLEEMRAKYGHDMEIIVGGEA